MSAATLMLGGDRATSRHTLALSLSLVLHLTFGVLFLWLAHRERPEPPIEISIFEGPKGPASPPPGENSAEPGPVGPPPEETKPVEGPKAPPAPKVKIAQPLRPTPQPVPVERSAQEQGLLAALRKTGPVPTTQAFDGTESSVKLGQAPSDGQAPTDTLGTARSKADVAVGAQLITGGPAVTDSAGSSVGSVVLPGPGGGGSGWNSASGGTGSGGGSGRGGFSVSGAGGAGRGYASIWDWTQRYLAGLRWAYNNELRISPALRGVMVVRYEILATGTVGDVNMVSSQLKDSQLEQAILEQIRGWRYPPEPSGTVVVTWPFSFLPPS